MALRILSSPSAPQELATQMRSAIEAALPGAQVEVRAGSPGHYSIRVVSSGFAGLSRLRQQQQVYAAIAHLMQGDAAPVHAVDELLTEVPAA
jgi:acid stress-induced BolA-like protein IbaG/YrbA